jgi:hypothetical protein
VSPFIKGEKRANPLEFGGGGLWPLRRSGASRLQPAGCVCVQQSAEALSERGMGNLGRMAVVRAACVCRCVPRMSYKEPAGCKSCLG